MSKTESFTNFLRRVRDPIARYQEPRGLSRLEQYSFVDLIKALCMHAYSATLSIVTMLYNLMPLFEGFTFLIRFILDRLIDIFETTEPSEKSLKVFIFGAQLVILFTLLYFIISILLIPILHFTLTFVNKIIRASVTTK